MLCSAGAKLQPASQPLVPGFARLYQSYSSLRSILSYNRVEDPAGNPHISLGTLPGLLDKIQGRLSQNSSLMMSKCSITTLALVRLFFSFSAWVLDCSTGSPRLSASSAALWLPGSTNSYYQSVSGCLLWGEGDTYVSEYNTALLVYLWLVVVVDGKFREQDLILVA